MVFAFAAPLGAEVNENEAAISAALTTGNSSEALVLTSQTFSALKPDQSVEAKALIRSILAAAPVELSGQVVVTAIEANPELVSCPINNMAFVAIKMGRRQGGPSRTGGRGRIS